MQCCSWHLVLTALCSCAEWTATYELSASGKHYIASTTWTSVCSFLLGPFWWGNVAVIWLICIHCAGGRFACRYFFFFFFQHKWKSSFESLSHKSLCPLSLLESLVPVFPQCRVVDFGPSSLLGNTASDMTCQQLQSYPNTPHCQKSLILPLPLIGPQSGAPSLHSKPLPAPLQPMVDSVTPLCPPLYVAWPMSFSPGAHLSVRLLFFCLVWFR